MDIADKLVLSDKITGVWFPMGLYSGFSTWSLRYWQAQKAKQIRPIDADPVGFITGFLETQTTISAGSVGPPFSILRLGPGNPQWIERGACQEHPTKQTQAK